MHFFVATPEKLTTTDSLNMVKAMKELQEKLNGPAVNYTDIATEVANKNSVQIKTGDIGYITVFSVPYEYENIIYNLKTGEASAPYRTRKGWHVFKAIEERKSAGKWKMAQIMFVFPPGDQPEYRKQLERKADSVYNVLQHGGDFAAMAAAISEDKLTYMTGGEMPEFGAGKFEPSFEKEIFKSDKEGFISKPIVASDGIHIIKVLKQTPTPTDKSDVTYMYELKQRVMQDARIAAAKDKFTKEILSQLNYKRNNAVKDADLFRYADSVATTQAPAPIKVFPINDKVIFTIAKNNYKGSDWLTFSRDFRNNPELYKGESNAVLLDKFIAASAQEYYRKHLEEYNNEFRLQMEEFKDGNVLFEIMERNVWGNAANDTVGLMKYYSEHKSNYQWGPSAGVVIFNANNKTTATEAINALKKGKSWKLLVGENNTNLQADSGRYELSQLPISTDKQPVEGLITEPIMNTPDGATGFIQIVKLFDGNQQRSFTEARGLVINDYQNVLEEAWVNDLKKKYPVKVNEAVFESILKQ